MTPRPCSRARGQWGKGAEGAGSGGLGSRENRWTRLQLCAAASTYPTCHRLLQRAWGGHLRGQGGTWSKRGTGPAHCPALASAQGGARLPLPPPPTYWSEGSQLPSANPSATCGYRGAFGPGRTEGRPAPRGPSRAPGDPPAAAAGAAAAAAGARGRPLSPQTCSTRTRRCMEAPPSADPSGDLRSRPEPRPQAATQ